MVVLLTWGESKEVDKLYYPTKQQDKKFNDPDSKRVWSSVPKMPIGGASDAPLHPRPDNAPYPVWEAAVPTEEA